jgi:hypothetical protein
MKDRTKHPRADKQENSRPVVAYTSDEFNMVSDLVHEVRTHVKRRRIGALGRTLITRRKDMQAGVSLVRSLPVVDVELSDTSVGAMIRERLGGKLPGRQLRVARAALRLPEDRASYLRGRPRQAVRTNLRHAETEGIVCRTLTRVEDQQAAMKDFFSRGPFTDADRVYVNEKLDINPGQQEFYCAEDADGNTIAIAAVAVDGACALLVFHHSGDGELTWKARYALSVHMISSLIERKVEVLLVGGTLTLEPGLRYFQQRLGFIPANIRIARAAGAPAPASIAPSYSGSAAG